MRTFYANDVDALVPELWANESLLILEEEMVMGNLVYRDFDNTLANYGETVHTRKPGEFVGVRKTNSEDVTNQDVSAQDVEVVLNQHVHVSFIIRDGEQTKAFKDLVALYLLPAMQANARTLDQALAAQAIKFLANTRGGLGQLSSSNAQNYLIDARDVLNQNKAYLDGRNLVLTSNSEAQMLKTDLFVSAERVGDGGRALREASLGRKFGFNCFMDLNTPSCSGAVTTTTTTKLATAKGATAPGDCLTAAVGVGTYITIAGDMTPIRSTTNSTTLVPTRAIREATASGAVVTKFPTGVVDYTSYASGYVKAIHVDGGAVPHVGQMVAFNNGDGATGTVRTPEYVIIQVDNTAGDDYDITLDRPLETALADGDLVCYGPNGDFNFAFHRNALALVNRPLALPLSGSGARAAVAAYNGMAMRVVIQYAGEKQGHRVTVDSLFGVKELDTALGAVLLG
jgi:hypothetical protein